MKHRIYSILLIAFLSFAFIPIGISQISYGGEPYSFSHQMLSPQYVQTDLAHLVIPSKESAKDCSALEFGQFLPLNIELGHDAWTQTPLNNGGRLYRLGIKSEGALAIGAYFSDFYLPEGAQLFIYSPDEEEYIGSFTHKNNSEEALFASQFHHGDALVIEYYEPKSVVGQGSFVISEILHAYIAIHNEEGEKDFGQSGLCEVNVNCPEGETRTDQRDAVLRILIKSGSSAFWCTGALVNNTSFDRTPYVLTADHCGKNADEQDMLLWLFYFHYQVWSCWTPPSEPARKSIRGCEKMAASSNAGIQGSDFFLVKLTEDIPEEYRPYFLGWSRAGVGSDQGFSIHHPWGDVKKISAYTEPLVDGSINSGTPNAYWEVFWSETENGHGVTEPGSSGSPIFNQDGILIGTLTGGQASCSESGLVAPDYYGKFSYHWDQNGNQNDQKLKPWLDPESTGALSLEGIYMGEEELQHVENDIFSMMPNPAHDILEIQITDSYKEVWIGIYDIQGKLIENLQMNSSNDIRVSLNHLNKGIYIVKAMNSSEYQTEKLVVE